MTEEQFRQIIREEITIKPELLMLKDVAAMLNISVPKARQLRDEGKFPFYELAGKRMFKRSDIEKFINDLPKGAC